MNGYWSYISERKLNRTLHRLVGLELCNAKAVLGRPVLLLFCERAERCRAFGIRLNARLLLNSALIEFAHCTFRPRDDELERFEHFFSHLKLGQVVTQCKYRHSDGMLTIRLNSTTFRVYSSLPDQIGEPAFIAHLNCKRLAVDTNRIIRYGRGSQKGGKLTKYASKSPATSV